MKVSLLTIGDELLIGQVLNSNVQWMSEKLTELGCTVTEHLTIGDKMDAISRALSFAVSDCDALILGGGLGPTHDDLTMDALSQHFQIPLQYDEDWISKVAAYFKARNRVMSDNNKKQGFLLQGATRIDNDCGTAAGQYFKVGKTRIFVVPGVPHEMKSMMTRFILPKLSEKLLPSGEKILKETLLTTGLGESLLADRLDPFVQKIKALPSVSLAFLPSNTQVRLRLQMKAKSKEDEALFQSLVQELAEGCGRDYFGVEPATLEDLIFNKLKQQGQSLAIAESCTGGLIAHRLTQVSGISEVLRGSLVAYQESIKTLELGIPDQLFRENGVVSEICVRSMAEKVRTKWGADFGLATTGYLGPQGGDAFASVGTVWIAVASKAGTIAHVFQYENHRERAKERASQSALDLLRRNLQ